MSSSWDLLLLCWRYGECLVPRARPCLMTHALMSCLSLSLSLSSQPREKGRMRFHRLQNVQIALDYLKRRQVRPVRKITNKDRVITFFLCSYSSFEIGLWAFKSQNIWHYISFCSVWFLNQLLWRKEVQVKKNSTYYRNTEYRKNI